MRKNDAAKREAKKNNKKISTKRIPAQPKEAHVAEASKTKTEFMNPLKFRYLF